MRMRLPKKAFCFLRVIFWSSRHMSDLNFDPFNLPMKMLAAIGLITSCSSQTEHIIEEAIAGLLGVDVEYGFAVTTHMTAPHRDNVLRAVAEIRLDSVH